MSQIPESYTSEENYLARISEMDDESLVNEMHRVSGAGMLVDQLREVGEAITPESLTEIANMLQNSFRNGVKELRSRGLEVNVSISGEEVNVDEVDVEGEKGGTRH